MNFKKVVWGLADFLQIDYFLSIFWNRSNDRSDTGNDMIAVSGLSDCVANRIMTLTRASTKLQNTAFSLSFQYSEPKTTGNNARLRLARENPSDKIS